MRLSRCLGLLSVSLLASCTQVRAPAPVTKLEVPRNEQACTKAGGHWGPMGLFQNVGCDIKTSDAGKACSDSSQCQATCLGPNGSLAGERVTGVCSAYVANFGNVTTVENGKAILLNVE